jgi:hypothetical protein
MGLRGSTQILMIEHSGEASRLFMRGPNIYTNKIFFKINIPNLIYKQKNSQ